MIRSRSIQILSVASALLVSACMAGPTSVDQRNASSVDDTASDDGAASAARAVVHMLPLHHTDRVTADGPTMCTRLTYFGGPLLTNVEVQPVFWNSAVRLVTNLNTFYPAVVRSPLFAMLSEYGIGLGSAHAVVVDTRTTASVTDNEIQTELNRLFGAGLLPLPTANTYYPVHFPPQMTITAPDGSRSCVAFCGYHSTFARNGFNVNYGVIPDIGSGGCAGGCGTGTVVSNTDAVSSHELAEAVTDPAVGLATMFGLPLGWIDPTTGEEIGDICNALPGTIPGFTVQKEWSNRACACVDH